MSRSIRTIALTLGLGLLALAPAAAQATHVVRMVADPSKDVYRFEPSSLTVHPKDVIVFQVGSGAPHSIVFEGEGMSAGVRGAFNSSMPGRSADLSSPLLTAAGKSYRLVVPQVPPGTYAFYCLPHRAYDMRGSLVIE
ncbi:MAG TPA: plastocyanin/azurin family copper-binding protein [Gemmatimonadales bacterium]|nr:plastocyanin/azurin family copper-binding protein [Gemmatimonadales bacterium]